MTTFKTYSDAAATLPNDAKWSCSFGYPGCGGFKDCFRDSQGRLFTISNGSWDAFEPFTWSVSAGPEPKPAPIQHQHKYFY
jgi:hypothetical protein